MNFQVSIQEKNKILNLNWLIIYRRANLCILETVEAGIILHKEKKLLIISAKSLNPIMNLMILISIKEVNNIIGVLLIKLFYTKKYMFYSSIIETLKAVCRLSWKNYQIKKTNKNSIGSVNIQKWNYLIYLLPKIFSKIYCHRFFLRINQYHRNLSNLKKSFYWHKSFCIWLPG